MKKSTINPENAAAAIFGDSRVNDIKDKEIKLVLSFPAWLHDVIYELTFRTHLTMKQMMIVALEEFTSKVDSIGDRRKINTYKCIFSVLDVNRYEGKFRSSVYLPSALCHELAEVAHYSRQSKSVVYCFALWEHLSREYSSLHPDIFVKDETEE